MRASLPAVLLGAATLACSPGPTHPRPAQPLDPTPHDRVAAEFGRVCDEIRASDDPYYGRATLDELQSYLAREAGAPAEVRAVLRARLAMEHLRWGDNERSVALLEEGLAIADEQRIRADLADDMRRRLGLAWLRVAEQRHCVAAANPAACILPLGPANRHTDPSAARRALAAWEPLETAADPVLRWLIEIARASAGERESLGGRPSQIGRFPRFRNVAAERGLLLQHPSGGAVADDFDGDGDPDLIATTIDPCASARLYLNDGRGRFRDATAGSGLEHQLGGLNLVHVDYDNDGDADLLILRGGWMGRSGRVRNSLLRNAGDATFEDVTAAAGLAEPAYPTQTAAFADYDLDGDLDLYVGNESDEDLYAGGSSREAYPSQLFRNQGDGTFVDVAADAGVRNDRFAKGVAWGDADGDGDPDLYVSNLGPNRLYVNRGDGTFADEAAQRGVRAPEGRSFTTWFFDYDGDGDLDLFVGDYGAALADVAGALLFGEPRPGHPRLYRNDGGRFEDVSAVSGLDAPALVMGANYGDLDADGLPEIYLGTGAPSFESLTPNLMYRNVDGERFERIDGAGGFGHLQKGHGVAFADFDGDGDVDLFEQMGGAYPGDAFPSVLYDNPGPAGSWVAVRLVGTRSPATPVGALLEVEARGPGGPLTRRRFLSSGGSFGGSPWTLHVGLAGAEEILELRVTWPGGRTERFPPVAPGSRVTLVEGRGER